MSWDTPWQITIILLQFQVSIDHLLNTDEVLYRYIRLTYNKYDSLDSVPLEELKEEIIKYFENKGVTAQITQRDFLG